jgi:hypothetical protein
MERTAMWVQMIALFLRHERLHWVAAAVALILATACLVSAVGMAAGALRYL